MAQKRQERLTGIQVLTKDFTFYKINYKSSKKESNTVKPIAYWETNCLLRNRRWYTVKLVSNHLLNQKNLISYTAKFETFLFDQDFKK